MKKLLCVLLFSGIALAQANQTNYPTANAAPLANPTFTGTATAPTYNATSGYQVNGVALASTNLSDTSNILRNNVANTMVTPGILDFGTIGWKFDGTVSGTTPVVSPGTAGAFNLSLPSILANDTFVTLNLANAFAPVARTSGVTPYFSIQIPADTSLTAATEAPGFQTLTAIRQWLTTVPTTQRETIFAAPTYAVSTGSQTITTAATVDITGAPIAGTNVSAITNDFALRIEAGQNQFPNGTSTAPSIVFAAGSGYGLFSASASNICLGTGAASNSSHCFLNTGIVRVISGGTIGFSSSATNAVTASDTAISRAAQGVIDVGTGAAGNTAGFIKTSQTLQVTGSNYTTTSTSLATAGVITGLNFTAPISFASNWSFHCDLIYSQATGTSANLWGVIIAGTAPTSLIIHGYVATNQTGTVVTNNQITSSTSTGLTVITATPSAFGAIGTNADMFEAEIKGTLEAPSNASPTQVGIAVATPSGSNALTIYRGSSCYWY